MFQQSPLIGGQPWIFDANQSAVLKKNGHDDPMQDEVIYNFTYLNTAIQMPLNNKLEL